MRLLPGSVAFACALATLTGACSHLMAQPARQPRPPQAGTQGPVQQASNPGTRPQQGTQGKQTAQVPDGHATIGARDPQPPLDPELEQILLDWERTSAQIKTIHGSHRRFVYNTVFETEKVSTGKFFLETPDRGRIDLEGVKQKPGAKSAKIGASGNPFRLESDGSEKWICTGREILIVNDDEKTYESVPLPDDLKGTNIVNGPLPFLFGMKVAEAKRRYKFTLKGNGEKQVSLAVVPQMESDKQHYRLAFVILDKQSYLPTAVKLYDPSGSLETVYTFESPKVNDKNWGALKIFGDAKPFEPNLKGKYKQVVRPPEDPKSVPSQPDPRSIQQPPRTMTPVPSQSNPRPTTGGSKK